MLSWKEYLEALIRYVFVILFIYAATYKLIEYTKFYNSLLNSPLLRNDMVAGILSWLTPTIEIITAGLLISSTYKKLGSYLSFILMLFFTLYIAGILLFSKEIPCSCGGIINNLTWNEHLIFNSCFLVLGAIGIYLQSMKTT